MSAPNDPRSGAYALRDARRRGQGEQAFATRSKGTVQMVIVVKHYILSVGMR